MVSLEDLFLPKDDKTPVYARDGWLIPTMEAPKDTAQMLRIRTKEVASWFPNATLRSISHPEYPYNCVGMIFAARRKWIEITHIRSILVHDGYYKINKADGKVGDIVLYRNHNNEYVHVALIIQIERISDTMAIKVISKWGRDAEFEHFVDYVPPYCGQPAEYWTERQL